MSYGRHLTFWLVTFAVLAAVLWLLHDILLPFVAASRSPICSRRSPTAWSASA